MGPIDEQPESAEQSIRQDEHHQDALIEGTCNGLPFGRILKGCPAKRATLGPQSWINVHDGSPHSYQMRYGAQRVPKREREQNDRQYQWSERNEDQIHPLVTQVHEDGGDNKDLCQRRADQKKSLQLFIDRRIAETQRE
jgi:hypothetical protein